MSELAAFEARFGRAYRRYLDEVPADVDAAGVARAVASARPRARFGPAPWMPGAARAFLWALLLGLLLAALVGAALLVGSRPPIVRSIALVPTGIDVVTVQTGEYARVVTDGKGILWAYEWGGRLVRYDPATGSGRSWTISDDAAFTMTQIAPARAGGVWMATGRTLRWFDGTAFREVIESPASISVLTEAPDGTLWAGTSDGGVLHWNGTSWHRLDPGRPNADAAVNAITVDTAGRVWVGWLQYPTPPGTGWVSLYDGSRWTQFDGNDAAPLGDGVWSIAELPDHSVWVASGSGLARFDGRSWSDETPREAVGLAMSSIDAAPDGVIWATSGNPDNGTISVGRFDGRSWAWHGTADGLPLDAGCYTAQVVPVGRNVFVGTCAGIYRLSSDRWEPAWPPASSGPAWLDVLLPVSHDELWATRRGDNGVWHFQHGTWTDEEIVPHPTSAPTAMTRAPDGTLWAASSDGVAYRRDGRWIVADASPARTIALDASGTVWVAGTDTWRTMRLNTGPELWTLRFDGNAWAKRVVEGCPLQSLGMPITSLAFDRTGVLWVAISRGYEPGGLARFDGQSWEIVAEIGGLKVDGATVLGTAPDGGVWIDVVMPWDATTAQPPTHRAARFDGTAWTVVEMPDGSWERWLAPALASDGTLWASTERGPARHDGRQWTYPYAGVAWPPTGGLWVAGDGTVFASVGSGLMRSPALSSSARPS